MKLFLSIIGILLFVSCETNNPENLTATLAETNDEIVQNVLNETVKVHNVPGSALLIKFPDGSLLKQTTGYANINSNDSAKMEITKQFRIGSLTKTFIGTAVLILVKNGKINLNDKIENLLPGVIKHGNDISLEMLLNQSSAIPDYTNADGFGEIYFYQPTYPWTKEKIMQLFKDEDLLDVPGRQSYYSNSN